MNFNEYDYDRYYEGYEDENSVSIMLKIIVFIIDFIFSMGVHYVFVYLFNSIWISYLEKTQILLCLIVLFFVSFSVNFLFIPSFLWKGQTLGKRIFNIKRCKSQGFNVSFIDNLIIYVCSYIFLVSIFCKLFSSNKKYLHEYITNTKIVTY